MNNIQPSEMCLIESGQHGEKRSLLPLTFFILAKMINFNRFAIPEFIDIDARPLYIT